MNKKSLYFIIGTLVVLIGLTVCLVCAFLGLYKNSRNLAQGESEGTPASDIVQYLKDSWHFEDGEWNGKARTATAVRIYDLTYEEAQKIGARVFTEDLAPESYLAQALTISADLSSRFSVKDVTVVISFRGNDGKELFSVDSQGTVSVCWDTAEEG